MDYNK